MPAVQYPRAALRPGNVVWAKVEGHDWWPACIVRRRAVPKEVGPPPGGQVRLYSYTAAIQWIFNITIHYKTFSGLKPDPSTSQRAVL
jgi:hypothetical protein